MFYRIFFLVVFAIGFIGCLQRVSDQLPNEIPEKSIDKADSGNSPEPQVGEEGGPCFANNTCNEGLTCLSNLCVNADGIDGSSEGTGDNPSDGSGEGTNDGVADGTSEGSEEDGGTAQGGSDGTGDGTNDGTSEGAAEDGGTAQGGSEGTVDGTNDGTGDGFTAPADSELVVSLTWDTAANDLDLHFRRDEGEFCSDTESCYWANCKIGSSFSSSQPDWDNDGDYPTAGDPIMTLDDLCGLGPEETYIQNPVDGTYLVGAHFFGGESCAGDSPDESSTATLKVKVNGVVEKEVSRVLQQKDHLWEAFKIHWQNGTATFTTVDYYDDYWSCLILDQENETPGDNHDAGPSD